MIWILFMGKLSSGLISIIFVIVLLASIKIVAYYIPLLKQVPIVFASCFWLRLNVVHVYLTPFI